MIFRAPLTCRLISLAHLVLGLLALAPAAYSQSPLFSFTAIDATGNSTLLASGGTITFPAIPVGGISSATVVIQNQGTGPGVINGISITAGNFQLAGGLFGGTSVPAGASVSFGINFTPTQLGSFQGTVQV